VTSELPTSFDAASAEPRLYERWVAAGYFRATAEATTVGGKPAYTIVIPPPNVTGQLHMGHAFQHTLMDALTRRKRMQGFNALWLPGTDHAGIATQNVVEAELAKDGLTRHALGREAFVARVWEWKEEYGGKILGQMRRLGDGVDWDRLRFTMDEGLSRAVRTIFTRMYHDGLIYRANRITNWCPRCLTALSDIEVEHSEDEGELVSLQYGPLVVATTRVETMLGDTAIAVHPDDERYKHLIGTTIELPLTGRHVPVVGDAHVDPEFGSGAVKVTPAHDPNDFAIAQRHNLPAITVMDDEARISYPGPFQGMDRFEARTAVTEALRELGLIVAEKRPYVHSVGHCSRCGTVVEPRLSLQWYVSVSPLAKAAGDFVREGRTSFVPPEMADRYFAWVDNLHDWCISRQLWWGHRIPVWYCPDGHVTVPRETDDPAACGECGRTDLEQDNDVLDTWFSSGLWPFSTLGWPDDTADLEVFYPTSVLVTGYDIIFFWVARMMMFASYAMKEVPFTEVAVTGLIRDAHGKKMSKSKGNVVDPLDWIGTYGADALRFTLAKGANPGTDVPIGEEWVQGSRNFVTKIWNATRFAAMNGADAAATLPPRAELALADRWILSRLNAVIAQADDLYERYEFARLADLLFHFAWDEVFDWYIELTKAPLAAGGEAAAGTRAVLGHVFDALLRLLHPITPFVTDELWTTLTGGESIVIAAWPAADAAYDDPDAERQIELLQAVVTEVRRFRAEQKIKPRTQMAAVLGSDDAAVTSLLSAVVPQVTALAGLSPLTIGDAPAGWQKLAAAGVRVDVDTSGAIDVAAERARLAKAIATWDKELAQVSAKLGNADFVAKAPEVVVEKMNRRRDEATGELGRLREHLAALPGE
jgi:valyl-tRNA synthetase